MTKIIPFKREHLECMDVREVDKVVVEYGDCFENTIAFTGIHDGRVIACGGLRTFLNTNAEVWLVSSIWVSQYKFTFLRYVRKWIDDIQRDLSLTRLQTYCINDKLHNDWMVFLGFEKEGILKCYFQGEDYALYGRVKNRE